MIRIILGVVVGFIAWSILWVGSDQVLIMLSPGWYGRHQIGLETADIIPFTADTSILIMTLVRSVIVSLLAGFLAAFVANENRKAPFALGVLLLIVGIAVQAGVWPYLPLWYHLAFLILLIPVTLLGARLRSGTSR